MAAPRARRDLGMIGRLRLASQRLAGGGAGQVPELVRWMTAMQAQDLPAALWAVGVRVPGAGISEVREAIDSGTVVRSWPMRGTLHLVAPEDLRWMLDLTAERLARSVAARHRQLDIAWADVEKARDIALDRIFADGPISRPELFRTLEAAGQPTQGQRGIHLLGALCRHGWLVLGPRAGNQQLIAAFDQWIPSPRRLGREEATAELLLRYFQSHGPATLRDFAWWTQLPLTQARAALQEISGQLESLEVDGSTYWMSQQTAAFLDTGLPGARSLHLLPGFDEFVLGYTDRTAVLEPGHFDQIVPGGNGIFKKTVVAAGRVIGTWSVEGAGRNAAVVPALFDPAGTLGPAAGKSLAKAGGQYLRFLES